MKKLSILDQRDFEPAVNIMARPTYYIRKAARAVVTDEDNCVALLYSKTRNYYKLPGGGIEENEDVLEALKREALEELGCAIDITGELGEVTEWRDTEQMKQISYCFTAKRKGAKGSPGFTDDEIADGFEVVWVPAAQVLERMAHARNHDDLMVKFMVNRDMAIAQSALEA